MHMEIVSTKEGLKEKERKRERKMGGGGREGREREAHLFHRSLHIPTHRLVSTLCFISTPTLRTIVPFFLLLLLMATRGNISLSPRSLRDLVVQQVRPCYNERLFQSPLNQILLLSNMTATVSLSLLFFLLLVQ